MHPIFKTVHLLIVSSAVAAGTALYVDYNESFLVQPHAYVYTAVMIALYLGPSELAAAAGAAVAVNFHYALLDFAALKSASNTPIRAPLSYVFAFAVAANIVALLAACWLAAGALVSCAHRPAAKLAAAEVHV